MICLYFSTSVPYTIPTLKALTLMSVEIGMTLGLVEP